MGYDHYRIRYAETQRYIYYISSLGYFERFDKKRYPDLKMYDDRIETLEGHIDKNIRRTFIINKWAINHVEVIKWFSPNKFTRNKKYIVHLNENVWDCNIDNLRVVSMAELQQEHRKGVRIKVEINGERVVHNSINELAKSIYISRSAITRYLQGKTDSPYLREIKLERL